MSYKTVILPFGQQLHYGYLTVDEVLNRYKDRGYRIVTFNVNDKTTIVKDSPIPWDEALKELLLEKNITFYEDEAYTGPAAMFILERTIIGDTLYENS
jgi:hypothetical protein